MLQFVDNFPQKGFRIERRIDDRFCQCFWVAWASDMAAARGCDDVPTRVAIKPRRQHLKFALVEAHRFAAQHNNMSSTITLRTFSALAKSSGSDRMCRFETIFAPAPKNETISRKTSQAKGYPVAKETIFPRAARLGRMLQNVFAAP